MGLVSEGLQIGKGRGGDRGTGDHGGNKSKGGCHPWRSSTLPPRKHGRTEILSLYVIYSQEVTRVCSKYILMLLKFIRKGTGSSCPEQTTLIP